MSPRVVAAVVGVAFLLAGLLILLLPLTTDSAEGVTIACGNGVGMGFDAVAVEAEGAAFVRICERLRGQRLWWGIPVGAVGAGLLVGSAVRRSPR
ncbi:hypothetical protein ACFXGA_30340 [Actinosynnema sp. NPDC059335]|uniref:hypothetical protein n=1 Tax=Actinosynnema sp. NPDC059335 TaxID=3346804 RepID=UPI00366DA80A